jgi:hypothetical protein
VDLCTHSGRPPAGTSQPEDNPESELLIFGNRLKRKRSELVKNFDLEGLSDERIISVAQKEMAADQRLREAKDAADQRAAEADRFSGVGEGGEGKPADQSSEPRPDDADGLGDKAIPPPGQTRLGCGEAFADFATRDRVLDADAARVASVPRILPNKAPWRKLERKHCADQAAAGAAPAGNEKGKEQ